MPCYPDQIIPQCPLCDRAYPWLRLSDHHLVPRSRGGKDTLPICTDCHRAIHATFSNRELEAEYNTVEALLAHPTFVKTVKFISKQTGGKVSTDRRKERSRRP